MVLPVVPPALGPPAVTAASRPRPPAREERLPHARAPLALRAGQASTELLAEALPRQAVEEEVEGVVEVEEEEAEGLDQVLSPRLLQGLGRGRGQAVEGLGRGQQQPAEGHAQQHGGQAAVEALRRSGGLGPLMLMLMLL